MGVLIAKLVQDSTQAAQRQTSDSGSGSGATTLPIDVEVGAAFQPAASATAIAGPLPEAAAATPALEAPARVPELALEGAPSVAGQ
jgi:hypothetical protein